MFEVQPEDGEIIVSHKWQWCFTLLFSGSLLLKGATAGELDLAAGELRPYSRNRIHSTDKHLL